MKWLLRSIEKELTEHAIIYTWVGRIIIFIIAYVLFEKKSILRHRKNLMIGA